MSITNPKEGDRIRHRETGQIHVFRGGQWDAVEVTPASSFGLNIADKGIADVANVLAGVAPRTLGGASTALAATADTGARAIQDLFAGRPTDVVGDFSRSFNSMSQTPAANRLLSAAMPGESLSEDIRAGIRATFSDMTTDEAREANAEDLREADEIFPFFSSAGRFSADAAALLTARRPVSNLRRDQAKKNVAEIEAYLDGSKRHIDEMPPLLRDKFNDFASDSMMKGLKRGRENLQSAGVKIGEAGLEGAFLAALNDGDPVTTAALTAGAQGAGSLALHMSLQPLKTNIPAWVAGMWVSHEIINAFGPGDQSFFESKDFAIQAATAALAVGALTALSGAGRIRGEAMAKYGQWADSLTALPRTFWTSHWEQWARNRKEGNVLPQQVSERMLADP